MPDKSFTSAYVIRREPGAKQVATSKNDILIIETAGYHESAAVQSYLDFEYGIERRGLDAYDVVERPEEVRRAQWSAREFLSGLRGSHGNRL